MGYVVLIFRRSGRWWAAECPDYYGAHSQGRTLASARANLLSAIEDLHGVTLEGRGRERRPYDGVVVEVFPCAVPA